MRGTQEVLVESELVKKLTRGKPLRIKAGFDPTAPGPASRPHRALNKMRQFQNFGHEVTFLIGDFTGMIGDPTGPQRHAPAAHPRTGRGERADLPGADLQDPGSRAGRASISTRAGSAAMTRGGAHRDRRRATRWRACSSATISRSATRAISRSRSTNSCIRSCRATTRSRSGATSSSAAPIRNSTCWSGASCRRATGRSRRSS